MSVARETHVFETEAKQILDMMIYSVYSNKDIFLRELVSNASDALDKLHLEALIDHDLAQYAKDPFIRLVRDEKDRNLSISDNGIGMDRDEIIAYIGTIAKSGTKEFLAALKERREGDPAEMLIGQFGVGFYSAFMVADKVTLLTKKAGSNIAWRWESSGDGTYTLEEAERPTPGTTVTLHLKEADHENGLKDYTSPWVIRDIVRTYSDFVAYPIKMQVERPKDDASGTVINDETLNSMKALWMRPEDQVTDEEYRQFYRHVAHDWQDPLERIVFATEGVTEMHGILFIPLKAPYDIFSEAGGRGVNLYVKRVFIMENCADILPGYLRFVRGVVDSEDLSLNISRELLQQDRQVRLIRKSVTRKVLQSLASMLKDDRERYDRFWNEFGIILKEGLIRGEGDDEAIRNICLFSSTRSEDDRITLGDYLDHMTSDQKHIHYITGPSVEILRSSPHLEVLLAKGEEVLLLADPVDELWVQGAEFQGKQFRSVAQTGENDKVEDAESSSSPLLGRVKDALKDLVKDVRFSHRLTASPACLVGTEDDVSPQMERIMRAMGQDVPEVRRVLELNGDHPVLKKMIALVESDDVDLAPFCYVLYGQALLAEGGNLKDPAEFVRQLSVIMDRALD
ncbi:MAG: molecular chaperone HtpG [Dethiosulfovibrio peptidovorans]|nr:MAG: molecular chaperone HtpG [Dethiosulfovibrio peptidovorans]